VLRPYSVAFVSLIGEIPLAATTGRSTRLRRVRGRAIPNDARAEIAALRAQLAHQRAEDAAKERELERTAADLRAASRRERQRSRELRETYTATVRALSNAVEARDAYTAHHAERVAAYATEIATAGGLVLGDEQQIEFGFLLHDIGKVGVSDAILYKPGALTEDERQHMQRHPVIGDEIIREIDFLAPARQVVRHHHERWDGTGYPDRLAGEEIPLAARVFALADALDAITSDRPYRAATPLDRAREMLHRSPGQFDPRILGALDEIPDRTIDEIRQRAA
jgi:ribonuclease P protein subunit RPR2